jgi:hypothetical protein
LVSSLAPPLHGLGVVLRYALAFIVHNTEKTLCLGIALVSQRANDAYRGGEVVAIISTSSMIAVK